MSLQDTIAIQNVNVLQQNVSTLKQQNSILTALNKQIRIQVAGVNNQIVGTQNLLVGQIMLTSGLNTVVLAITQLTSQLENNGKRSSKLTDAVNDSMDTTADVSKTFNTLQGAFTTAINRFSASSNPSSLKSSKLDGGGKDIGSGLTTLFPELANQVSLMSDQWKQTFVKIGEFISDNLAKPFRAIGNTNIGQKLGQVSKGFGQIGKGISKLGAKGFKLAATPFTAMGKLGVDKFRSAASGMRDMASQMVTMTLITQPLQSFLGALLEPLGVLNPLMEMMGSILGQALMPIVEALIPVFMSLVPIIVDLAVSLDPLMQAIARLLPPIGQVVSKLLTAMGPALDTLITAFVSLLDAFMPIITALAEWEGLWTALAWIFNAVATAIATVIGWLTTLIDKITFWTDDY